MHHEFCQLTALAIPYEQYINQIEPLYMNSPLQKQEFCKNWVEQHNDNINNLKTIKKDIIVDIKQIISFRKVNYSNIVFAHCRTGYDEYDTEIGNHVWQGDTDEQFEAREKYFSNIEIKYKTKWGLKQAGLI